MGMGMHMCTACAPHATCTCTCASHVHACACALQCVHALWRVHGVCRAQHLLRARRGAQGGPQPAVCIVQAWVGGPERVAERGAQRGLRLCETRLVVQ